MRFTPHTKLLFIGDSITDCGRERPVGEGNGLGNGYVSLINALLSAAYPDKPVRVQNVGTSGNTVSDLAARWQTDVLDLNPDWLTIMIGINDVWRQFDSPLQVEGHVGLEEYTATLKDLIKKAQPGLKGLILMTPFFIESTKSDRMRSMMDTYGAVVRQLAHDNQAVFVDTQAAFDAYLKHHHPMSLAWDRVHPNLTGHMLLARAFLEKIEYKLW